MTLKEKLETVRGREIALRMPVDKIPCNETSDKAALCKRPLVSVLMTTYNQEHSIRQAIESALDQETDFEYEIVIGEDCSSDRTREICFEYQKKFPGKIRVLWSEENVFKMCGNGPRVCYRCRGEFLAILEGDDCWIDRHKLQKQVDVFRRNPSVGICIGGGVLHDIQTKERIKWDGFLFKPGFMRGLDFLDQIIFESWRVKKGLTVLTPSVMLRRSSLETARKEQEIFTWNLLTLDTLCWAGVASVSDAYYLADEIGQYNSTPGSLSFDPLCDLNGDSLTVKIYFALQHARRKWRGLPAQFLYRFAMGIVKKYSTAAPYEQQEAFKLLMEDPDVSQLLFMPSFTVVLWSLRMGVLSGCWANIVKRFLGYAFKIRQFCVDR